MRMLKKALIAYVNSAKAVWSAVAHPLSIVSKLKRNVKDYKIFGKTQYGKNLLDVQKYYGQWANDKGGIDVPNAATLYHLTYKAQSITGVFKENTQYTFSCKYNIDETTTTVLAVRFNYTDGTKNYQNFGLNYLMGEGAMSFTSASGKTVQSFNFTYGTTSKIFKGELTEMMIAEGTDTEYEPCIPQYVGDVVAEGDNTGKYHLPIEVRGKNILDISKYTVTQGYYLDSSGSPTSSNKRFLKISPIVVKPSTQYTISIGSNHYLYTIWYFEGENNTGITRINVYNLRTKTFTTPENCNYIRVSIDSINSGGTAVPSDLEWAMLEKGEGDGIYEPYIEPQTVDIYLDAPLADGDVIQKSVDKLPSLPQFKGTTVYEVQTAVSPSGIQVEYYE